MCGYCSPCNKQKKNYWPNLCSSHSNTHERTMFKCIHEWLLHWYHLFANKMRNVSVHAIKFHLDSQTECRCAKGKKFNWLLVCAFVRDFFIHFCTLNKHAMALSLLGQSFFIPDRQCNHSLNNHVVCVIVIANNK